MGNPPCCRAVPARFTQLIQPSTRLLRTLLVALPLMAAGNAGAATGDDPDTATMAQLQAQVRQLQQKLDAMQTRQDAQARELAAAGQAASASAASRDGAKTSAPGGAPGSLSFDGFTLYGTADIGITYMSHGTPLSASYGPGLGYQISKNSNRSITSAAPNALGQSKLGIRGRQDINDDLAVVSRFESAFVPTSGQVADGLKSLVRNNGVPLDRQISSGDSSRAGQVFQGAAYVGLDSKQLGTLTAGRQNSLMLDNVIAYDPLHASNAFSIIGYAGLTAGMGDTETARLDQSLKYQYKTGPWRFGGIYQFGDSDSESRKAYQLDIGADWAGFSADAIYGRIYSAVSASSLSAAQAAAAPVGTLAATVSDNTAYGLLARYVRGPWQLFGGYEHIRFANPGDPRVAGDATVGGYILSFVTNNAYTINRIQQVLWTGATYAVTSNLDLTGAYYFYKQDSYHGDGCSSAAFSSCAGKLNAYTALGDYKLSKRLDVYAGAMFSRVSGGLSSGYLHTSTIDPTLGLKFVF